MTNEELIQIRKLLTKYTEWNLKRVKDKENVQDPEFVSVLEMVNFIDRANKVAYDIERQIEVK